MAIHTPEWVKHAVFYQIFPDRFARSSRLELPPGITLKPWGSPPEEQGFQGGDLLGIVDKLDYLQDLGVTALYLNPVFASPANHRYHTYDYFQVDPLLGGNAALRELLDEAHRRDIRVVLDGVFNHTGRGFWAFHHILENGKESPYLDWFTVLDWPLRPYRHSKRKPHNYASWWNLPALPKLNVQNPGVRQYLLKVARHWIDFGIDGWRLDVPEEIDDPSFWREFRETVKAGNSEAYLCGEIWHLAGDWLRGDRFDAVMNYPLGNAAVNFFGAQTLQSYRKSADLVLKALKAAGFSRRIEKILAAYQWEAICAQLNLLDSHDTARALWMVGEDQSALRLSVLFMMSMPGAPCIYYGDEIGLSAGDDPHCRGAFPWDAEERWDGDLRKFYQAAIKLRKRHPALRCGSYQTLYAKKRIFALGREDGGEKIIALFNAGKKPQKLTLKVKKMAAEGETFQTVWGASGSYAVHQGKLTDIALPPREAVVLANRS